MSVILAIAGQSGQGGYTNPHVTLDLRSYGAFIGWPPATPMDVGVAPVVAMTHVVAAAHPIAINGSAAHSYADDWYDRIHVIPPLINLGNLLSAQVRPVSVWNAWRTRVETLQSETLTNASGITLTDPAPLPVAMQPLEMLTWQVAIDVKGAASIDATVDWSFADPTQPARLAITGNRVVAFYARPNWSDGITERLSFATDVKIARHSRREQRRCLRATPRRSFEFALALQGDARRRAATRIYGWSSSVYALPIWPHVQRLAAPIGAGATTIACDTAYRDFAAGGLAILTDEKDYEAVEIDTLAAGTLTLARATAKAWSAGAWLAPARLARLTSTGGAQATSDKAPLRVAFETVEPCSWPVHEFGPTYRGWPVLERRPNWRDGLDISSTRETDTIDVVSQAAFEIDPSGIAFPTQGYRTLLRGLADQSDWRGWLYARNGRQKAVWVPSFTADLDLIGIVAASDTSLVVANLDYTPFLQGSPGRRDLRILLKDGSILYRHITASAVEGDAERIAIDAALGRTVAPDDVALIGWLQLVRLAADDIEIQHYAVGSSETTTAVIGVRDDDV